MKNTSKRNLKQLPKRCFALFLAMLILLSTIPMASFALDFGSTGTVQKDGTIPGFSYNFSGGDGKALGLPHRNAQGQYDRLSVNGNVAYCVECGDKASVGKNATVTDLSQLLRDADNMSSDEKASYMTFALMYGYTGATKYGYSADVERAATQAFIWLITTGDVADSSISNTCLYNPFSASLTATEQNFFNFAFKSSSYESMNPTYAAQARDVVAKLKEQIYLHEVVPSFMTRNSNQVSSKKVILKYNASTKLFEASLTDTNGVLQDYQFSMNGVNFAKSGNTLKISTANLILTPTTLTAERVSNKYTAPADVVAGGYANNQDGCVAISRRDPMRAYMQLETEALGSVKLIKTSEDGRIANVPLHISGNGVE
ncbi:MAG: thioester domain-containing protein, partial [Lachnospiraceae bacterium]